MLQSIPHDDMGIDIEARPTQLEWNQFYADIAQMELNGQIKAEDKVQLRRFQNLKQAYSYLKVLTLKREKSAQQFELQKIKENNDGAGQAAMLASQEALKLADFERQTQLGLKQLDMMADQKKHGYKMQEIAAMVSLQNAGKMAVAELEGDNGLEEAEIKAKAQKKLPSKTK
jgi:hypothetical protein